MKNNLFFYTFLLFSFLMTSVSCTDNDNPTDKSESEDGKVEMMIYTVRDDVESRGLTPTGDDFDYNYDPNSIFLHVIGREETIEIPLYTKTCSQEENEVCKCFSYHYDQFEDGSARITPILNDGSLASESLTVKADEQCYFSSVEESILKIGDGHVYSKTNPNHNFYTKDLNFNKETYRSEENFSVNDLAGNIETLLIERACAGFNLLGLFYDAVAMNNKPTGGYIPFSESEFTTVMGSAPSNWYIKVYIGGPTYTNEFDLGTMQSTSDHISGYYSTGTLGINNNQFLPFTVSEYGHGKHFLQSYGYYTTIGNELLAPVLGEPIDVYILIKEWTGNDSGPTDEWLSSDNDALYTKVDLTGDSGYTPTNNNFYILGLVMDIRQFKKAWDNAQASRPSTTSRSANGMHYFELKDAKVIFEAY